MFVWWANSICFSLGLLFIRVAGLYISTLSFSLVLVCLSGVFVFVFFSFDCCLSCFFIFLVVVWDWWTYIRTLVLWASGPQFAPRYCVSYGGVYYFCSGVYVLFVVSYFRDGWLVAWFVLGVVLSLFVFWMCWFFCYPLSCVMLLMFMVISSPSLYSWVLCGRSYLVLYCISYFFSLFFDCVWCLGDFMLMLVGLLFCFFGFSFYFFLFLLGIAFLVFAF